MSVRGGPLRTVIGSTGVMLMKGEGREADEGPKGSRWPLCSQIHFLSFLCSVQHLTGAQAVFPSFPASGPPAGFARRPGQKARGSKKSGAGCVCGPFPASDPAPERPVSSVASAPTGQAHGGLPHLLVTLAPVPWQHWLLSLTR